jgi:dCTP deaminase
MALMRRPPKAASQPPGFWTGRMIAARQEVAQTAGRPIISDFVASRLERASYRLCVGDEIFISPSSDKDPKSRQLLKARETRAIPPGQFAFLCTEETVSVPADAIAFLSLRSKPTKFRGLVNVSGFYVEPLYEGNLVFAVYNAGPASIHVARGDEWFEIFFASLAEAVEEGRDKPGFKGIPTDLITPLSHEFLSLPGLDGKIDQTKTDLDDRIQRIEREHAVVRWSLGLIVAAVIAVGVKTCTTSEARAGVVQGVVAGNQPSP